LPKDLRAVTRFAQREALETPLLNAILPSNEEHLRRAMELVDESGCRRIGLVGLSFKAGTDDLRESPFVALAETLIGKGCDVKIYDPGVSIARLKGQNLAYIDQHLPHLARLLVERPEQICEHAELVVLGTAVGDSFPWRDRFRHPVIDLRRDLVTSQPVEREGA
ncbi:MAG: hypothetical protein KDA42_06665, partial [Planctomycetales bacterium]|nr:hypothetical protein [Planctomycetales bacterium]